MTNWLEYGWTLSKDAWTAINDAGEAALGYVLAAVEVLLILSLLAAMAQTLVVLASGAPLWVSVLLFFVS